jgi:hypothetical protein
MLLYGEFVYLYGEYLLNYDYSVSYLGHAVTQLVEALRYK